MAHVVVMGAGVAGLGAAIAFSRDGHEVTLIERDAMPLPPTPVEAFESWDRPGAPQVWHSHAFLARLRNLLLERAPDVREQLLEHGAWEFSFTDSIPPTMTDFTPEPGDEELVLLACRRITFEWVLRRIALESGRVEWRGGLEVVGLEKTSDATPPRITGVRVASGSGASETIVADLVVDAGGRRSRLPHWLLEVGAAPVLQQTEACGIFYGSRFYRLREGAGTPNPDQLLVAADLGYLKFAVFPGDAGIFSTTLAASPDDAALRSILRTAQYEAALQAIPAMAEWVDPERSEPITDVRGMAGLRNQRRSFVESGVPIALGVHAIGDAAIHTNPLYGRGCTLAMVHAFGLADLFRLHGDDANDLALAFDAFTTSEIVPWYRAALIQDREAREVAAAERDGGGKDASPSDPKAPVDPRAFMRSVLRDGLLPALRTDPVVLRAFVRGFNLMTAPEELMQDPQLLQRILLAWQDRENRASEKPQGPPRERMVDVLARAA